MHCLVRETGHETRTLTGTGESENAGEKSEKGMGLEGGSDRRALKQKCLILDGRLNDENGDQGIEETGLCNDE